MRARHACKRYGAGSAAAAAMIVALLGLTASAAGTRHAGVRVEDVDGVAYVGVRDLARYYRMDYGVDPVFLGNALHRFTFRPESRRAEYNGDTVWLHEAPHHASRRGWSLTQADRRALIDPLLRPQIHLAHVPRGAVVIDAGHGGEDTGAEGQNGTVEKYLALELAREVQARLTAGGHDSVLTRTTDRPLSLEERCRIAAANGASLLVSLHFNAASNADASGIETYILPAHGFRSTSGGEPGPEPHPGNRYDGANLLLGRYLHHQLIRTVRAEDRGIRRARFVVLREAPCPAALLECGFLSNAEEERKILSPFYREALAAAIATGIADYLRAAAAAGDQSADRRPRG